jgi:hypothetical protein
MIGNNNQGWDHICTANERHGMWDPERSFDGEPCFNYVRGVPCKGTYKLVGAGSRTARKTQVSA